MKAILIILQLTFINNIILSQNMVLNGDFETIKYCQRSNVVIDSILAYHLEPVPFYADYWYFPISTHADYLHDSCSNKMRKWLLRIYNVAPHKEGKGFVGFNLYGPDGFFEPVTGSLSKPMLKDSIYKVGLKLCYMKDFSEFYSKKIGVKFTENLQVYPLPFQKNESNYVEMFNKGMFVNADHEINISELADSTYWQEFSFSYKAKGGERYITIGMFYQSGFDLINYSKQFASVCWNKKAKPWLRLHKDTPVLVFKGNISTFLNLDESQKCACYYLLDDVSVKLNTTGE